MIRGRSIVQRRVLSPTRSYLSQCEPVARFGLGDARGKVLVKVHFPNGARHAEHLEVGRRHQIRNAGTQPSSPSPAP